jgi:uncharacterized protein YndB with AHSA1/START domain
MPTDLIHRIDFAAPVEKIYRAITAEDGIQAWWTTDVQMDAHVGGNAVFGFFDHSTVFQMRIEELTPPSLVRWKCVANTTSPDWIGTTQEFRLEPQAGGDHCYYCNTTWGHLLVCLKQYAERGVKSPYFT